jgi:(S)-sulfolactate dehydrogenase
VTDLAAVAARRARIVVTEFMDERAVARLKAAHDVLYDPALWEKPAALLDAATGADALIVRNITQVRGDLLHALQRCRVVGRLGVGLDNIDLPGCATRGIEVIPASGANALSVAEYVITSALVLLRGAYASTGDVIDGKWPKVALGKGREAGGQTLGIVGLGSIGRSVADLARALGMQVVAHDPLLQAGAPAVSDAAGGTVAMLGLGELLARADAVTLHVPLTGSTRGFFNAERIASMKPGAVLINTSRGHIMDLQAVVAALRAGHLGGAAIDVFDEEPLPASAWLKDCPRLLLTPHIAGVSAQSNERVSFMIADKVLEAIASWPA